MCNLFLIFFILFFMFFILWQRCAGAGVQESTFLAECFKDLYTYSQST